MGMRRLRYMRGMDGADEDNGEGDHGVWNHDTQWAGIMKNGDGYV